MLRETDPLHWLLGGGDDHALAACFPPDVDLPMAWSVWNCSSTFSKSAGVAFREPRMSSSFFTNFAVSYATACFA